MYAQYCFDQHKNDTNAIITSNWTEDEYLDYEVEFCIGQFYKPQILDIIGTRATATASFAAMPTASISLTLNQLLNNFIKSMHSGDFRMMTFKQD